MGSDVKKKTINSFYVYFFFLKYKNKKTKREMVLDKIAMHHVQQIKKEINNKNLLYLIEHIYLHHII